VNTRLQELLLLAAPALEPDAAAAQHDMRIAAKRLRYVLEITGLCFGPEAGAARLAAEQLQDVLGEIHDCDVLLPRAVGIESLESRLRARREGLFESFRELWQSQRETGTWSELSRSLPG
jgi:CHAD domain-containing protein